MVSNPKIAELAQGFSKLNLPQRLDRLVEMGVLTPEDVAFLTHEQAFPTELAEKLIENVIGYFHLPLGVATNFRIDGKDYIVPMAVEETSIIAAASKTARWVRDQGNLTTETIGKSSIGQIHLAKVKDFQKFQNSLIAKKVEFINDANRHVAQSLVARGGGMVDMHIRKITRSDGQAMAVVHVLVDACDAMGANMITQICEYLKAPIEELTGETVTMCILSNLNDTKLARAKVVLENIEPELGEKLEEASFFAELDPYRAATNNKGTLNGMDAVLIATGNDWRAVEAGVHAYVARNGHYGSLTKWRYANKKLTGSLEAPIAVGIVGGMTKLHPTAKLGLKMLDVKHATDLARIVAAVGLVQNLGAIRALTTFGFIEGHMKLHINNLTLAAGAKEHEIPLLKQRLEQILATNKRISLTSAVNVLNEIRN